MILHIMLNIRMEKDKIFHRCIKVVGLNELFLGRYKEILIIR